MRTFIIKRLFWMIPTIIVITMISYGMMRIAPGDPVRANMMASGGGGDDALGTMKAGQESTAAKQFKKRFNLDKPWIVGYFLWIKNIAMPRGEKNIQPGDHWLWAYMPKGDFGCSLTIQLGTPVWDLIKDRMPVTIKLNLWAMAIVYLVAIPFGLYSAVFRNSVGDRIFSTLFFILYSVPSFWLGLVLILIISKYYPTWPTSGIYSNLPADSTYWQILLDTGKRYVLPVICMSYGSFAGLSRFSRVGMLEVIRQDYIRTARAKGLSEWKVIMKHALRNSVIPLITMMAGMLPAMIGGSVMIEFLFGIPGMGTLGLDALGSRDYPVLITLFSFSTLLTLFGILISDITYSIVDPRITFD
jgi:peptide/nickel transport system permease protein